MKTLDLEYLARPLANKVWQAPMKPEVIQQRQAGISVVNYNKVETEYRLGVGEIHDKILEVPVNKLLVQEWFADKLELPLEMTFFKKKDHETKVRLMNKSVSDDHVRDIAEGWRINCLEPIAHLWGLNT